VSHVFTFEVVITCTNESRCLLVRRHVITLISYHANSIVFSLTTASLQWRIPQIASFFFATSALPAITSLLACGGCQQQSLFLQSQQGLGIFLFTTASRPTLRPTQRLIPWGQRGRGVKLTTHLNLVPGPRMLHSPNMPPWRGAELKNHRNNFVFTFKLPSYLSAPTHLYRVLCSGSFISLHPWIT
jgi:hypothetical protein